MTRFFIISENGTQIEIENIGKVELERFGNKDLWYGEFVPPLLYEDKEVSKISFTRISYSPDIVAVDHGILLDISIHSMVTLILFSVPGTL
jgi:hypothetical protein